MDNLPVDNISIIIKAPNQKVDDLCITCNPNWTIQELKHYLHEVYPSKPHPTGQKLIYSGKLLLDNAVVTDILRSYSGQQNNTIHLVCASTKDSLYNELSNNLYAKENHPATERTEPASESISSTFSSYKHNNAPAVSNQNNFQRQRAYLMYTYMQYIMHHTQSHPLIQQEFVDEPANEAELRPEFQPRPVIPAQNIDNIGDEDRQANRDWLDWVYILSRLVVLFTVVYFYSSPLRCFMVTAMALVLYHLGMFRWRPFEMNNLLNNINNNNDGQAEDNLRGPDQNHQTDGILNLQFRFGWVRVIFNFIISFLLSLVPDNRDN